MLLDQVFDGFEHIKWIFVRKNGKLKKIRKVIQQETPVPAESDKPMFPISKERK